MTYLQIALKDVQRRRTRSLLTAFGIAVSIGAVVTLTSIAWGFERSWQQAYDARGTDAVVTRASSENTLPAPFDMSLKGDLLQLPDVQRVAGLLSALLSVENAPLMFVFGWEYGSFLWDHLNLVSGRWPRSDEEPAVVLGSLAAEITGKQVGDHLQIEMTDFEVVGIFDSAAVVESGAVIMSLTRMQHMTQSERQVNFFSLRMHPGTTVAEQAQLRDTIRSRFPGYVAVSSGELVQENFIVRIAKAMSWATVVLAVLIGAAGVFNTMLMSVFERTREIGVLLAIGWQRQRVVQLLLLESLLLALAGGVGGLALGLVGIEGIQLADAVRGKIEGQITPGLMLLALALALGLGLLGGLYPALRASRLQPAQALHSD